MFPPRHLRVAALLLILAWFVLPELQNAIPIWIPFVGIVVLELHFVIAGLREGPPRSSRLGREPQAADLSDFGGEEWLEPVLVRIDGRDVWLPATGKSEAELFELIEKARDALEPGEQTPPRQSRSRHRRIYRRLAATQPLAGILDQLEHLRLALAGRGEPHVASVDPDEDRLEPLLPAEVRQVCGLRLATEARRAG